MLAAPTGFEVAGFNTTSISVQWTEAEGSKDHYEVNCTAVNGDGDGDSKTVGEGTNTATCNDLTQGTLYSVDIKTTKGGFEMEDCRACSLTNITG